LFIIALSITQFVTKVFYQLVPSEDVQQHSGASRVMQQHSGANTDKLK